VALGWFGSDPNANSTAKCLTEPYPYGSGVEPVSTVPFSSTRKWSAVTFGPRSFHPGTWLLGAPDMVLDPSGPAGNHALTVASRLAATGRRTLILAHAPETHWTDGEDPFLPATVVPVVLLTFREKVRPDAAQTLAYFADQGVGIRIISGDDPRTVAAVAREVGLATDNGYDARSLPQDPGEMADVLDRHTVFGRVTPAQKKDMVRALQRRGHVVAMTGDGVNDALALKHADIGIAMDSASAATKAVARLVLLDGRFDRLPGVVAEGRRVIANVERVSMLFLAKTAYAVILSVIFGALLWGFPFLPRQLSATDGITIGIPAFFLALMPNTSRYRPGFLKRSLSFAVPAGVIVALSVTATSIYFRTSDPEGPARTGSVLVLTVVALWVLVVLSRPLNRWRLLVIAVMGAGLVLVLALPLTADFFDLAPLPQEHLRSCLIVAAGGVLAIEALFRIHQHPLNPVTRAGR
jgi:cation-transporting ATPase E